MRVLAVVPSQYDTSPGQRFRIEQWAPRLAAAGIEVSFAPFETAHLHDVLYREGHRREKITGIAVGLVRRLGMLRTVREFDLVYVFREAALLGPAVIERLISRSGIPLIFDFDDAVFEPYISPANGHLSRLKFPGKVAAVCRIASHVLAGNSYLADYAGRYTSRVTIVPTTIDTDSYRPTSRPSNSSMVIGWSGSHSTLQHLRLVDRALQRLASAREFRLRVIGTPSYALPGVVVDSIEWRAQSEVADLQPIDVGIMPLPDDRWTRGKCGLKALQYMALAIPTICSPVGVNQAIIRHGVNGLLANDEDAWVHELTLLIDNVDLRRRLGGAGRKTVEEMYSTNVQVPIVRDLFKSVAGARSRS